MWARRGGLRVLELGTPGPMRDRLVDLVLAGRQGLQADPTTAVVCLNFTLDTVATGVPDR